MIKHIVMWTLRNKADAEILKDKLEALHGKIPGLLKIEAGININLGEQAADLVLYSELQDIDALEVYQNHPEHQAIVPLVKASAISRSVVDYEVA
ncbi:MAG: Dabb family protein [Mariprofundaceae bacterium]